MRVLIVGQYFWPEGFRINEIAKSLVESGVEVDVLTANPNYPEGKVFAGYTAAKTSSEIWNGVTIYRLPTFTRGGGGGFRRVFNYFSFIFFASLFGPWLLRRRKYDTVFVYAVSPIFQAIPAIFLSKIKKIPLVIWVQDLWPESLDAMGAIKNKKILSIIEFFVRKVYKHTDLLLVQSQAFIKPVQNLAPTKKVIYYPNSVDSFFGESNPQESEIASKLVTGFSVVFAGNIGIGQAVEVIIEAAVKLKDYKDINFVIVGQGSRWEWMNQQVQVKELLNVFLPGRFPVETMPAFMQKASALLVTLADQPIFAMTVPNKIQAYLASGRPIIACLNGEGARMVAEAEAGISVPAGNAQALADAILRLYNMPTQAREKMGINGRNFYKKHFNHDELIIELIKHLHSSIASHRDTGTV
ncbi:MAG: glycosyltransferase family 4 protein [Bdellovibrionaceae bacterium]|nr:glycosyltransferase family 4 protein [Bdellovibrio sp.]